MKKSTQLIAVVVALAALYPAAAWYTGKRVEEQLAGAKSQPQASPYVKVVKQDYQRGVFSSVQDTTIELTLTNFPGAKKTDAAAVTQAEPAAGDAAPSAEAAAAETAVEAVPEARKPVQLHFINRIQHGPLPGFSGFGAAAIKTELVLDAESKAQLAKVFGTANPLDISTRLGYAGGGRVSISSPAFNTVLEKERDKISWQGLNLEVSFEKDYKTFTLALNAPGLSIEGPDGKSAKLGAISMKAEGSKAYPGTSIYLGTLNASLASFNFINTAVDSKSMSLEQLTLATDTSMKDDLIDGMAKIGIGKISYDKQEYSGIHYDYGIKRLHGPSIAKISAAYSNTAGDMEKIAAIKAAWEEVAPQILQKEPEFVLERLSAVTPDGEAKMAGSAKLIGASLADFANPLFLITKIQANLDITMTDSLIAKYNESSQKDPDMQKVAQENMDRQIAAFIEAGFINRNGKSLSSKLEWKQGKMTVNGKPFSK